MACWPSGLRRKAQSESQRSPRPAALQWMEMRRTLSFPSWRHHSFTRRQRSGREMSVSSVFSQLAAPLVHAAAALGQGDVRFLRHQERGIQAPGREGGDDAAGKEPVLGVSG